MSSDGESRNRGKFKSAAAKGREYPPPFSLRLSFEDRAALEKAAAGMPLGAYIRWRALDPDKPPPRSRGKFPVKDHQALGRVLGELGRSRLANNLNQLARAVNSGSLPVTPDTEIAIRAACEDIALMRADLIKALGLDPGPEPEP